MATQVQPLSIFIAVLTLSNCGRRDSVEARADQPYLPLTEGISAEEYDWDDANCVYAAPISQPLASFTGTSWESDKPRDVSKKVPTKLIPGGTIDPQILGGSILANGVYSRSCREQVGISTCTDDENKEQLWSPTANAGDTPRLCKTEGKYNRDSLERITLETARNIFEVRNFIRKAFLESGAISTVDIKIMPRFETIRPDSDDNTRSASVVVDQMSYFPSRSKGSSTTPFIAVFPRLKGSDVDGIRLWESQFVISHEFGHHLEAVLGLDHFLAKRTLVRAAISEGFADLVGFSTLGLDDDELNHMPCLSDRSVSAAKFSDHVSKVVDLALYNALSGREKEQKQISWHQSEEDFMIAAQGTKACKAPLRVAPHGLGAIFAHIVYKMSRSVMEESNVAANTKPLVVANFVKTWLKNVEEQVGAGKDIISDLNAVATSIEITAQTTLKSEGIPVTKELATKLCKQLQYDFSGLGRSGWFGQSACPSE